MTQPQRYPLVVRALPYFNLADVVLRIAERVVYFRHSNGSGSHRLTEHEISTLRNGGTVVFEGACGTRFDLRQS